MVEGQSGRASTNDAGDVSASFVLECHLGHRTYAENLRETMDDFAELTAHWFPIEYREAGDWRDHLPVPSSIRPIINARREMRPVFRAGADVTVFNTQVPAVIGPRSVRRRPYVLITDVTPRQYDRLGEDYGHTPDGNGPLGTVKHRWNRRVMRRAARCIAWSTWVSKSLTAEYGIAPSRIRVIPPGVDLDRWEAAPRSRSARPKLLFVGADFERKGGADLLQAFASLPAGSADLTIVTKSVVPAVNGVNVVSDLGPNDPRLVQLYADSDIFVLPSRSEAFGIAAVEASASGLAVVATAVGGLTDIVDDGTTGFTVPPGDAGLLSQRLRLLVEQPDVLAAQGRAARKRAEIRFDSSANARLLLDTVRECAGSGGGGSDASGAETA